MNSSMSPFLTYLYSPPSQRTTSSPLESTVVKFWSIVEENSSSERAALCYLRSVSTCAEKASKESRSSSCKGSPNICFHTDGARFKATGYFDRIPKAIKAPKYLNISRCVGLFEVESRTKQSRFGPCSFRLLGDFISKGTDPLSISSTTLTIESLNGPPTSILFSPAKLIL